MYFVDSVGDCAGDFEDAVVGFLIQLLLAKGYVGNRWRG